MDSDKPNLDLSFSQRIGKRPLTKESQLESMDIELRNKLWNSIKIFYLDQMQMRDLQIGIPRLRNFANRLWHGFYKLPIDLIPKQDHVIEATIRQRYFKFEWEEVYDFIEFILKADYNQKVKENFINSVNITLEKEFSGYRIINDIISPLSNPIEFEEVSNALSQTNRMTALQGANIHLENALVLLSDKNHPNYRNSFENRYDLLPK